MKRLEKKHPLAVRWLHWINFPLLFMIWSGILIYWASAVYGIRLFGYCCSISSPCGSTKPSVSLINSSTASRSTSSSCGSFLVNGVLYVAYTIISGEWRALVPVPGSNAPAHDARAPQRSSQRRADVRCLQTARGDLSEHRCKQERVRLLTSVMSTEASAPNARSRFSAQVTPAKPPPKITTRVLTSRGGSGGIRSAPNNRTAKSLNA